MSPWIEAVVGAVLIYALAHAIIETWFGAKYRFVRRLAAKVERPNE